MSKQEIKAFENACKVERREDGYYIRHEQADEMVGPYKNAMDAMRYYRLIWSVA